MVFSLKIIFAQIYYQKITRLILDFHKHINKNFTFLKNSKLLIAVSGGVDSVVLSHLIAQLNFEISIAHFNFRLRGKDSELDEAFVQNLANKLQADIYVTSYDTQTYASKKNLSIQMAARELRYAWFNQLIKVHDFDYVLTAHHADDNLETFLINFSRGTGLDGLTGIPEVNEQFVRPLLPFSRNQIELYAKENNLSWREDQSNAETKYLRNKIRHEIIPLLKTLNPSLLESFSHTIDHLKSSQQIISDCMKDLNQQITFVENGLIKYDIEQLKKLSNPKAYLFELLKNYGFTEWHDVLNLLEAQPGKQVFSKTHRLLKDRAFLILTEISENTAPKASFKIDASDDKISLEAYDLILKEVPNPYDFTEKLSNNEKQCIYTDKSLLIFPLTVRKWQKGDYFYPLGMGGKKKLSKFFKDEKLSILDKENIWVLCSDDKIVWVMNQRQDDRFKINKNTKKTLKIEIVR